VEQGGQKAVGPGAWVPGPWVTAGLVVVGCFLAADLRPDVPPQLVVLVGLLAAGALVLLRGGLVAVSRSGWMPGCPKTGAAQLKGAKGAIQASLFTIADGQTKGVAAKPPPGGVAGRIAPGTSLKVP
jgi:hypothetical protein